MTARKREIEESPRVSVSPHPEHERDAMNVNEVAYRDEATEARSARSPLEDAISEASAQVDKVSALVRTLADRLGPVLLPERDEVPSQEVAAIPPQRSELTKAAYDVATSARLIQRRLSDLIDRLDA